MRHLFVYTFLWTFLINPALSAQQEEKTEILVNEKTVTRIDSLLQIDMIIDISGMTVSGNQSVVCTPLIERGDSLVKLPSFMLNGRTRHILYERMSAKQQEQAKEYRRYNNTRQQIQYQARIPFHKWMEKSEVYLVTDLCGCGWESLANKKSPLFPIRIAKPVVLQPSLAYRVPLVETVKARALQGSAFLDFPVNKTVIYPDYRKNPRELAAIRATIDSVRLNKNAMITKVCIKGYASPEGSYANNTRLAKGRSEALLNYIRSLYDFSDVQMTVDYEPEDWEGLEREVMVSDLAEKADILAIIRDPEPKDMDKKEWKLKQLAGGKPYQYLLREIYPGLRHSDYTVGYTIRNFTVEEAKELLYRDPAQLSLSEMFQVAQTYESGSPEFNEVFEIAVRIYPNDPISNLNAANTAIREGKAEEALRYLDRTDDTPYRTLAQASLLMLEGKTDEAKILLTPLADHADTQIAEAARDNLRQIQAYIEYNE
ncbi:DUF3868 domain-containing protein [uncultured Parabacteroides sp.]|uniref:DUF3868 domain-containing protein n=1 Tax=uncultured Parabacteroides sp. TaxID=512312 RepID=UPI00261C42B2|nr:DUF3868 domain-containing protein [uncultured Parabacteroides sp.]